MDITYEWNADNQTIYAFYFITLSAYLKKSEQLMHIHLTNALNQIEKELYQED